MGLPMAARIAGGDGLNVTAFDLSADTRAAAAKFAATSDSVEDAINGADVICTMVPADRHLLSIVDQVAPVATDGQIFVDFSTVSPGAIDQAAKQLAGSGVAVIGASCMKSVAAAQTGELSLYVGGCADGLAALNPVFDRVAADWRDVGSAPAAKTMKIANNLLTATMGFALLDGIVLAWVLGCPPKRAVEELIASGVDSWVLRKQVVDHALADDLGEGIFSVEYMSKDLELAACLATAVGRPSFFAALVLSSYRGLRRMGLERAYHPAVVRWIERISNAGPISSAPPDSTVDTAALWPALRRVQQIVIDEALRIVEATGIPRVAAGELLQAGSAQSSCLDELLDHPFDRAEATDELRSARELAVTARLPALSLELALQLAISAGAETRGGMRSPTRSQ
jgi:3-hydroxyisobutyrate dehydrogenase-like beta-hydroxyacid dehydrogenase